MPSLLDKVDEPVCSLRYMQVWFGHILLAKNIWVTFEFLLLEKKKFRLTLLLLTLWNLIVYCRYWKCYFRFIIVSSHIYQDIVRYFEHASMVQVFGTLFLVICHFLMWIVSVSSENRSRCPSNPLHPTYNAMSQCIRKGTSWHFWTDYTRWQPLLSIL